MNEKNMAEMQKHIEALRDENEAIALDNIALKKFAEVRNKAFNISSIANIFLVIIYSIWIYALYYANSLLATDNQTKENWKRSAITLLDRSEKCQYDLEYAIQGFSEAREKGFITSTPPPLVKDSK